MLFWGDGSFYTFGGFGSFFFFLQALRFFWENVLMLLGLSSIFSWGFLSFSGPFCMSRSGWDEWKKLAKRRKPQAVGLVGTEGGGLEPKAHGRSLFGQSRCLGGERSMLSRNPS